MEEMLEVSFPALLLSQDKYVYPFRPLVHDHFPYSNDQNKGNVNPFRHNDVFLLT